MLYVVTAVAARKTTPPPLSGTPLHIYGCVRFFGIFGASPTLAPACVGGIVAGMKPTFIVLLALVVAVGCQTTPRGINQTSKVKIGTPIWEFEIGSLVWASPAIGSDGTVYIGAHDKKVYALDGKSGARKWEFETGDIVFSSPSIGSDGTLYVGSEDKKVYALDDVVFVRVLTFRELFVRILTVKTKKMRAEITSKTAAESRRDLCSETQS